MGYPYEVIYYEEEGGGCRTEDFLETLEGTCEAEADDLLSRLLENGPALSGTKFAKPLKGKQNGLWELIDFCHKRAIRFYYWRSGESQFTIAIGELKEGTEPGKTELAYATERFQEWKKEQKALRDSKNARGASRKTRRRKKR